MSDTGYLNIGPVQWVVQSDSDGAVRYSDPAYRGFWTDSSGSNPQVSMEVLVRREARPVPAHDPLYSGGKNWALWEENRDLIICSRFYGQTVAHVYCRLNRESGLAEVFIDPARGEQDASLRYPLDQILSWGLLAKCGGLILHSSVAVKNGVGWVFSGRSGAGKSTIAGLCHQAGWRILNDDRVMVFKRGQEWRVAGTPWHGSGRFSEATEVPLGGLFFIQKSDDWQIQPIGADEIRYALLDVAAVPWFEDDWAQGALDAADRFAREVSFHRLHFSKNPSLMHPLETFCAQSAGVEM